MRPTALIVLGFLVVACGPGQSSSDETPTTPTTTIGSTRGGSGHLTERESPTTPPPDDTPDVTKSGTDDDGRQGLPPPVVVRNGTNVLRLDPWTFCYGTSSVTMCADGFPPNPLPDAGTGDELEITFPVEGWTFSASFQSVDHPSARPRPSKSNEPAPTASLCSRERPHRNLRSRTLRSGQLGT